MAVRKIQPGPVLCGAGIAVALVSLLAGGTHSAETAGALGGLACAGLGLALILQQELLEPRRAGGDSGDPAAEEPGTGNDRQTLEQLSAELQAELERRARLLDEREAQLANRLIAFQEWLEYPLPDRDAVDGGMPQPFAAPELEARDRQVIELLETEARFVYERIRDGRYREEGQLNVEAVRNDALDLIERVARIYQPDCGNPLLETSVDQLLRAGSRICLHLLVVLERLPLDLHQENLSTLHEYLRKAVKAYDLYTAAEPYLGYASRALYAGRLAMGANPVTLGIAWALGELGRRGVRSVGQKFVDQQAVALLADLVRVIGYEVAGIFGGDFRHRDPNWVFGSELTELMSRFPVSRQNLAHALREIGSLAFRNEYDRVFLYRCLSTHRSAGPPAASHEFLQPEVRQDIVRRLESFFRNFVHGKTASRVVDWTEGVEARLGLRLRLDPETETSLSTEVSAGHDAAAAVSSLLAFAVAVKGRAVEELTPTGIAPATASVVGESVVQEVLKQSMNAPPQFFDGADIDPDSELADAWLNDLIHLAVHSPPLDVQADELVVEAGVWLGRDAAAIRKQLDTEYVRLLSGLLPEEAPKRGLQANPVRVLLQELLPGETLQCVYPNVRIRDSDSASALSPRNSLRDADLWLCGTGQRLLLIAESEPLAVATTPLTGLTARKGDGLVVSACDLHGTRWVLPGHADPVVMDLIVPGGVMTRFDNWFRPLMDLVRQSD